MPVPRLVAIAHSPTRAVAPLQLATGLVSLGAFAALAQGVRRRRLRRFDDAVRRAVHPKRDRPLTAVANAVSTVAKPHVHPLIAGAIALGAWPRLRRRALLIPAAAVISTVLDRATRQVVQQHRPPGAPRHPGRDRYAFPSGHTTAATAIALVTSIELDDRVTPPARYALRAAALLAPAIVGATRLYLDEHWADDVLGGMLAGTAIACVLTGIVPED